MEGIDPFSQAGKWPAPAEHVQVLVVGAGPAGVAAALEAVRLGASVTLVDEHPVSGASIGSDIPFYFGGRAGAAVNNKGRMTEQVVAANPGLSALFEAGVEVMIGTCCWGVYVNRPGLQTLERPMAGLANDGRCWMVSFERLILAAGARDLVYSFPGAGLPGVMGALGFHALLDQYDAFTGRTVLVLGGGELAMGVARSALAKGLTVCGLVEAGECAPGDAGPVPVLTGRVIRAAQGDLNGVRSVLLADVREVAPDIELACDTVVLALGRVPVIELADMAGLAIGFDGPHGGFVPADGEAVFCAGDCAGLVSEGVAAEQGRAAARAALGVPGAARVAADEVVDMEYRLAWMRALLAVAPDAPVCQCEEVSRADLLEVRAPRYLGPPSAASLRRGLPSLAQDGPVSQDQVKRLTRAGMGVCQGRRCREQIAMLLSIRSGQGLGQAALAGYRGPVRPLPLSLLADAAEEAGMAAGWDIWFGIPTQWVPYDDVGTEREAEFLGLHSHL